MNAPKNIKEIFNGKSIDDEVQSQGFYGFRKGNFEKCILNNTNYGQLTCDYFFPRLIKKFSSHIDFSANKDTFKNNFQLFNAI